MKDAHLSILVATSVLTCWDGFSKVQKKKNHISVLPPVILLSQ